MSIGFGVIYCCIVFKDYVETYMKNMGEDEHQKEPFSNEQGFSELIDPPVYII